MKRTAFDATKDQEITQSGGNFMPCRYCGKATLTETLSMYGARCFSCYEEYLRTPRPQHPRSSYAQKVRAEIEAMGKKVPQ